ncbi:Bardet-Biedl syndrome 7 protein homolog [Tetranychus urticae]|uniref:Bardet-Biedl syndrome 7 protein homolog n=1 Tax=Tetranychus urticae TaxID=32264 RepID=T1KSQ0_TETUR|nr:Bardet-Biedl syndrome 7 protein homolog [Tetranychus urticae]
MDVKLNRVDYLQVGLTSPNTLKVLSPGSSDNHMTIVAVVGDHSGSLCCFSLRHDSTNVSTIFKTLPGPNAKITSVQVVRGSSSSASPKILVAFGSSVIRGYTAKGKQFFGLELNNLTEPIRHLQIKWPADVYICGHFIYNHYVLTSESAEADNKSSIIQSKNFYVSPGKITGLILIENNLTKKTVPIISCEDRLIRILKDSMCQYEIETCGIPNVLFSLNKLNRSSESFFTYGTLEGKVALISLDFSKNPLKAVHKWEIPEKGSRAQVNCIAMMESTGELYIGRSDGSIEVWIFVETLEADGSQSINVDLRPIFRTEFNCGESLTSICICRDGTLLLCCTFTGFIFGLTRNQVVNLTNDQVSLMMSRDAETRIETLKSEINDLEKKISREREYYQDLTSGFPAKGFRSSPGYSALPYFAINDSMILQEDASYLLTLESEVAIDSIVVQSDIPIDLLDCERNSAVVTFNENWSSEVLATFRCQANTTRIEIKIRSIEGQYGTLRVYIMTRMSPKSCQVKHYTIKALSLHKRTHNNLNQTIDSTQVNQLHIFGSFGLNESLNWLQLCLPEIPERVNINNSSSMKYTFMSTLMDTFLIVDCSKGSLTFQSDNISTISILKDFLTREATKKSIPIEMTLKVNGISLGQTIRKLFPKLKQLLGEKRKGLLLEAIKDLRINDPEIANSMLTELNVELPSIPVQFNLERLYGLITDLYLDYIKLEGINSSVNVTNIKTKLNELISLIEESKGNEQQFETLIENLNEFWGLRTLT